MERKEARQTDSFKELRQRSTMTCSIEILGYRKETEIRHEQDWD